MTDNHAICQAFATKHGLIFKPSGEVGFGRPCAGFMGPDGDGYIDYLPRDGDTYNPIPGFDDERINAPDDVEAYHKHNCVAVLGDGAEAVAGLARWVTAMEAVGVEVAEYETTQHDFTAYLAGKHGQRCKRHALRVKAAS